MSDYNSIAEVVLAMQPAFVIYLRRTVMEPLRVRVLDTFIRNKATTKATRSVKFDLGLSRYVASVLIFVSHCVTARIMRDGVDPNTSTISQFVQMFLGLPSLVLLCLMTGAVANLTPVPELSKHDALSRYLNDTPGLWFRLSAVCNGIMIPLLSLIKAQYIGRDTTPIEIDPFAILLGIGAFWYLPALMYWSILRIWVRTPRQMLMFCLALLPVITVFWLMPETGYVMTSIGRRVNRILIGIWFMSLGYLQGPGFFGQLARLSTAKMIGLLALLLLGTIGHEAIMRTLFSEGRVISYYLQPPATDLNRDASGIWDVPIYVRLLAASQALWMWALIFGVSLVHLYVTSRLGSAFSSKNRVLLAETSFTIYILHAPLLTTLFGILFAKLPNAAVVPAALAFATILSIMFILVTLLIRRSIWLRFALWYKL